MTPVENLAQQIVGAHLAGLLQAVNMAGAALGAHPRPAGLPCRMSVTMPNELAELCRTALAGALSFHRLGDKGNTVEIEPLEGGWSQFTHRVTL